MRTLTIFALLSIPAVALAKPKPVAAPIAPPEREHAVKWMMESEEYYRVAQQTYAMAEGVVLSQAAFLPSDARWTVVMDLDETVLDNQQYQVENTTFSDATWQAWEARKEALVTPGAADFIAAVHRAGGHVAYVTNREDETSTHDVIVKLGLFTDADILCVTAKDDAGKWISEKRTRRDEVRTGQGKCSWGAPAVVLGYFGDQRGDFPDVDEAAPLPGGASPWGQVNFMLPNPMYGGWDRKPNRPVPR